MKAITRIETQNFQSHANTVIEPSEAGRLTVLTGATDSGKSAVFRALRWLYYGGPHYVRKGCTAASVTVHLEDGTIVTRQRSGSANRYVVTRPGQEPQIFEGFGRDIPLEVQHALGVRPLDIAGITLEVNLARQHDPAFLVSSVSAPARAKALGQIAGVEAVDMAMRSAGRDIFEGQRELKAVEGEIGELEEQVRQYDYLPALADRIAHVEGLIDRLKAAEDRKDRLVSAKLRLESSRTQQVEWEAVRRRTAGAASALAAIDRAQGLAARRPTLGRISRALTDCSTREAEMKVVLARTAGAGQALSLVSGVQDRLERRRRLTSLRDLLTGFDEGRNRVERQKGSLAAVLSIVGPALQEAEEKTQRLATLRRIKGQLRELKESESVWTRKKVEAGMEVESAQQAYAATLKQIGRCPTCGGAIDHEHLKEVV